MIELKDITKIYKGSDYETYALREVNLKIKEGDFVSIMGTSGSGKSTLLNILGFMDSPTSGQYILDGTDVTDLKPSKQNHIRKEKIGFIFQNFALMKAYTVYENIEMPLLARGIGSSERKKKINEVMESLKITDIKNKLPNHISGGQQQRCAIARALVTDCEYLLADEPTGALDKKNTSEFMKLLCDINARGKTIILVTHDDKVAEYASSHYLIEDGVMSQI